MFQNINCGSKKYKVLSPTPSEQLKSYYKFPGAFQKSCSFWSFSRIYCQCVCNGAFFFHLVLLLSQDPAQELVRLFLKVQNWQKTTKFYFLNSSCSHLNNIYPLGLQFYKEKHNAHVMFSYFIDLLPKVLITHTHIELNLCFSGNNF